MALGEPARQSGCDQVELGGDDEAEQHGDRRQQADPERRVVHRLEDVVEPADSDAAQNAPLSSPMKVPAKSRPAKSEPAART